MLHFADVSPLDLVPEDDPNRRKVEQQVHDLMKVSLAISAVLIMGTIVYGYLSYMAGA